MTERDFGGHFACMECPKEMVQDMREFFGESKGEEVKGIVIFST